MNYSWLYFSKMGRINRKGYVLSSIGLLIFNVIFSAVAGALIGVLSGGVTKFTVNFLSFLTTFVVIYPAYCIIIKRLHDRNRTEMLAYVFLAPLVLYPFLQFFEITGSVQQVVMFGQNILTFVPNNLGTMYSILTLAFGLWSFVELVILRGMVGPNEHGPDPSI